MKYRLALGLLAALAVAITSTPARAVDQEAIDRAVTKGVAALRGMQTAEGTWPHEYIGATALAGLTLLECGADKEDKDVLRAAQAVRKHSIHLTHTYCISLSLLFLDRLGDPADVPFIESLMERLLGGQDPRSGGWSYTCPAPSEAVKQKLQENLDNRKSATRRDADKPGEKRKEGDAPGRPGPLPQREAVVPGFPQVPVAPGVDMPGMVGGSGDNSNTQFAALGLWVGRRHGAKIDEAVTRLGQRFRETQMEDGGWTYVGRLPGMPGQARMYPGMGSTPSMTCAGLLALAIADGATLEHFRKRKPDAKLPDISKDKHLQKGLEALGAVIDNPKGREGRDVGRDGPRFPIGGPFIPTQGVGGRSYYFLWSLERVAVALDLKTIGKKDWYGWGAEILLENQSPDGTWSGSYATGGVDTCFALLFLRRANLVGDLTASLKGKFTDPGERVLSGGTRKAPGQDKMLSGLETKDSKPVEQTLKAIAPESRELADSLLKATGPGRDELIGTMENEKGVKYTEALAAAIPKLEGEAHRRAREALANRLTRMKDETLQEYFQDGDAEIRRAAAIAAGQKDSKALVPHLISLLRDTEISVVRAAHASLKALTGKDFGPAGTASREQRDQAVQKWIAWWSKQRKS
ncbi:MAG TPA: HEAT repeat domain-containing protein [Gemmataceae bacterium]|jgi:hypothetical protein